MSLSLYKHHVAKWENCDKCLLCKHRTRVVIARGKVPAEILFIGEAPGACITGDTLIDTAYRDKTKYPGGVPIKDLIGKTDFKVYAYDINQQKLTLDTVKKVWKTGVKLVYKVSYFWWGGKPGGGGGRHKYFGSICVTTNHPFLLKNGEYRSIKTGLSTGDRLQPFYRRNGEYDQIGVSSKALVRESRFLTEQSIGYQLQNDEEVHHANRNKLDDAESNLVLTTTAEHARIHGLEDNAMFNPKHRKTHQEVVSSNLYRENHRRIMSAIFADPEIRQQRAIQNRKVAHKTSATLKIKFATDPIFYYNYLCSRNFRGRIYTQSEIQNKFCHRFPKVEFPPEENHQVYKIEKIGLSPVYDMEVQTHHNFAANGIFVHNSEDVIGLPFVGPAGRLLDHFTDRAIDGQHDYALTNLVCCLPKTDAKDKEEPPKEAIVACKDRLTEFIKLCQPDLIICVGTLPRKHVPKLEGINYAAITHPAAILRMDASQQPLAIKRCIVTIEDAISLYL